MPYADINRPETSDQPVFQLHWASAEAGGNAQISFNVPISMAEEQVRVTREAGGDWPVGIEPAFTYYSGMLSRQEINEAIRALRRMRNAVYGSDE